ncbi:MAG: hypothetical protein ACI9FN_002811 [Saprospiraceae bacterium]|jgi:hypothetical protein
MNRISRVYNLALVLTIGFFLVFKAFSQEDWMKEYDFVFLDEVLESTQYEVRYHSHDNFIGKPIEGYFSDR